jgi:hypothetical protein
LPREAVRVRPGHERALKARRGLLEAVNMHFKVISVSKCQNSIVDTIRVL